MIKININFGTMDLLIGPLFFVFNCQNTQFNDFGYTLVYWNNQLICAI